MSTRTARSLRQIELLQTAIHNTSREIEGKTDIQITTTELLNCESPIIPPLFDGRFKHNLVETGRRRPALLTPDGVVYTTHSHAIAKTEDWGKTWIDITDNNAVDLPHTVRQLGKLHTGELIASCTQGYIYKSDENEENWRLVYEFGSGKGHSFADMGFQVYGDIVLTGSYGDPLQHAVVLLSRDGGETFEEILSFRGESSADTEVKHIHDVKFDPYEGLIWVTTGDDYLEENSLENRILVSGDWGESWAEFRGYRAAQIMPFPKCVIFAGDNPGRISVARYMRRREGTASITDSPKRQPSWPTIPELLIEEVWFGAIMPNETGAGYWATNSAIRYGSRPFAAFGLMHGSVDPLQPVKIWATTDGIRFYVLWMSDVLGYRLESYVGGVFGPDDEGNLAAAVMLDGSWHLLRLHTGE